MPTSGKRSAVFICHSSQDTEFALQLQQDLEKHGLTARLEENLKVGDSRIAGVSAWMEQSEYLIVVLSEALKQSGWGQAQLNSGLINQLSQGGSKVLPALRDDSCLPWLLQDRVYADFRIDYQAGLRKLLEVFPPQETPASAAHLLTLSQQGAIADALLQCPVWRQEAAIDRVKARLPFMAPIRSNATLQEVVSDLVVACVRQPRGLEALLDALRQERDDPGSLDAVHQTLGTLLPQAVSWQEMTELRALVGQENISDTTTKTAFRKVVGPIARMPVCTTEESLFVCVLDELAKVAEAPGAKPLLQFLTRCGYSGQNLQARPDIRNWMQRVAQEHKINLTRLQTNLEANPTVASEVAVLLIKIEPAIEAMGRYLVDAWLYPQQNIPRSVHVSMPTEVTERQHSEEDLGRVIKQIATASLNHLPDPATEILLEVILPFDLLSCNLDQNEVRFGKRTSLPLGKQHALTVRSWDRLYDLDYRDTWFLWKTNWNLMLRRQTPGF